MTEELNRPPISIEAEQWLLGGIMLDNLMWDSVVERVGPEDFYRRDHQIIFKAMVAQAEANQPLDVLTLSEHLKSRNQLDDVGGFAYLSRLVAETGSAANVRSYADIVRDRRLLRQLIHVGTEISQSAYHPEGQTPKELVDLAERRVFEIAEQGSRNQAGFVTLAERCTDLAQMLDERHTKGDAITGLPSGYDKFDAITQGLQPGDLLILAARPSMGKTTLALNIAEYSAFKTDKPVPVAIFSMEMSTDQLALRFISSLGRVPQGSLRNGKFDERDWSRIGAAIRQMSSAPVHIDDTLF